jgi:spermidine/putrescine transport system ATP-binding protein
MSVLENVAFGLRQRKIAEPLVKAQAALDMVELGHMS